MKLYIGCALTQAPDEFKKKIDSIKDELRKEYEILDFVGLVAGTASDVYKWDIHECIEKCDVFVAIADYPALGLGYEIGVSVEKLSKPTLVLAHKDALITRLILGVDSPDYKFLRYELIEEIPELIKTFVSGYKK